jgi:conjugative relaxase-like TrwC/TraI family protein
MIGIKHLKGSGPVAAAAVAEYLKALRNAKGIGYYSEKGGAPSRWLGEGARRLGLEGPVDEKVLTELLQGRLPDGTDISERGGRKASRRMGTDLTISAPKSFSMLVAGAPPEERAALMRLWDEAVAEAARVIEREAITARRGGQGRAGVEYTGNMVAAVFTHEDARPVDGRADMDIHGHLLVMNMTQRADGQWVARDLDFGKQNVIRMTADFAAKAVLAQGLQKMGHAIRPTKDGFEVAAFTDPEIRLFSRRTVQIDNTLTDRGLTRQDSTSSQRNATNLATRQDKLQLSQEEQRWEWRQRLREAGLDMDAIVAEAKERGPIESPDLTTEAVASAARHLGERESVFSKRMTRLEALKAGMGNTTLDTVDAAITANAAGLIDVGGDKLTTRDALYREQEILARARAGRDQAPAIVTVGVAQSLIAKTEAAQGYPLTQGQREAITLALAAPDRVVGIVGAWGVGKTTGVVRPIVAQAKQSGFHTIGITPTTKARKELAGAKPDQLMTIAAWLQTKPQTSAQGKIIRDEKRLIVMDEAAMVGSEDMARVLQKLDTEGGRMILVGDPQQLRSVAAGTPMQQMLETNAIQVARVTEVVRQTDKRLLEMAQVWANGDAPAAVAIAQEYMQTVTVTESDWEAAGKEAPDPEKAGEERDTSNIKPTAKMIRLAEETGMEAPSEASFQEVREWLDEHTKTPLGFEERHKGEAPEKKPSIPREVRAAAIARATAERYLSFTQERREDTIMMAFTNKMRRDINSRVRDALQARGEVSVTHEVPVRALDRADMTQEQMARAESYQGREDLVVRLSEGRGKNRREVDYKVVGVETGRVLLENDEGDRKSWNPATANKPRVYTARDMSLAQGDVIAFRDNSGKHTDPNRIDNGEVGKVTHVDASGVTVRMDDGRDVVLDPTRRQVVDYGWAVTIHAGQGATKGGALLGMESAAGMEAIADLGGVGFTREKQYLDVITDDIEKLSKKLEKWAVHETAMAATKTAHTPDLERIQALRAQASQALGQAGDLSKARDRAEEPVELAQAREEERALKKQRELEQEMDR